MITLRVDKSRAVKISGGLRQGHGLRLDVAERADNSRPRPLRSSAQSCIAHPRYGSGDRACSMRCSGNTDVGRIAGRGGNRICAACGFTGRALDHAAVKNRSGEHTACSGSTTQAGTHGSSDHTADADHFQGAISDAAGPGVITLGRCSRNSLRQSPTGRHRTFHAKVSTWVRRRL